jgi:hypothetical protein
VKRNFCPTENGKPKRGRPPKPGRSVRVTIRFREGEHDEILQRLGEVGPGGWSAYIRRVLEGAPIEVLDRAIVEDDEMTDALNSMWLDELDDEDL